VRCPRTCGGVEEAVERHDGSVAEVVELDSASSQDVCARDAPPADFFRHRSGVPPFIVRNESSG
jgi:hypothetical protein